MPGNEQGKLFDVPEVMTLSVGQRRTREHERILHSGRHPATGAELAEGTDTCGDCEHAIHISGGNRKFWKCQLHRLGMNRSEASDIRVGWPACTRFKNDA